MHRRICMALFVLLFLQGCGILRIGSRAPLPVPVTWADQIRKAALVNRLFADAVSASLDAEPPLLTVAQAEPLVEATESIAKAVNSTNDSWNKWQAGEITKRDFLRDFEKAVLELASLRDASGPLQLLVSGLALLAVNELEMEITGALQLEAAK
ncbi:MAG: hypothetical protein V3R83_09845 [Gammaproteobacteria bacterium]